jgi:hypothetical protein
MNCGEESAHCELKEETSNVCLTAHCFERMVGDMMMMMMMMMMICCCVVL